MTVHGPHDPSRGTPARHPGSVRRTSSIDMTWPDGLRERRLMLTGRARDLRSDGPGNPHVVDDVTVTAVVDRSDASRLTELEVSPAVAGVAALIGEPVASGFRAAVGRELPEHAGACTPVFLLPDDLPVAALISRHAYQLRPE